MQFGTGHIAYRQTGMIDCTVPSLPAKDDVQEGASMVLLDAVKSCEVRLSECGPQLPLLHVVRRAETFRQSIYDFTRHPHIRFAIQADVQSHAAV
jgi:hypothetical protein